MNSIKNEALNLAKEYQKKLSRFIIGIIQEKNYNFEFTCSDQNEKLKVQVYFGKKGVKTVIQGNQNSRLYNEVTSLINDQQSLLLEAAPKIIDEPSDYIGADESGKGDFFGPLVTAAVYADAEDLNKLKAIGAVDSKLLNDNQIYNISEKIKDILYDKFIVSSLTPELYNKVYSEKKNLNRLLREEHQKNINELLKRFSTKSVIIDSFEKKPFTLSGRINIIQTEKAERFTAVAAASILARAEMVKWFEDNLIEEFIKLPKGASTEVNSFLKNFKSSKKTNWANFCKLHFKNYTNIKT